MSAVRDCLFNIFAAAHHIGSRSFTRKLRTRHAVVTWTHLSRTGTLTLENSTRCSHRVYVFCVHHGGERDIRLIQGGSNMTGIDLCVNLATSVPVIFEPTCTSLTGCSSKYITKVESKCYVYWTVHHCDSWRIRDQLDVTTYFISLLVFSTCFEH